MNNNRFQLIITDPGLLAMIEQVMNQYSITRNRALMHLLTKWYGMSIVIEKNRGESQNDHHNRISDNTSNNVPDSEPDQNFFSD